MYLGSRYLSNCGFADRTADVLRLVLGYLCNTLFRPFQSRDRYRIGFNRGTDVFVTAPILQCREWPNNAVLSPAAHSPLGCLCNPDRALHAIYVVINQSLWRRRLLLAETFSRLEPISFAGSPSSCFLLPPDWPTSRRLTAPTFSPT
jgi:hypothetical protein